MQGLWALLLMSRKCPASYSLTLPQRLIYDLWSPSAHTAEGETNGISACGRMLRISRLR